MDKPRTSANRSSRSDVTRAKLIDATLEVIADEGLAAVSSRTVANRAAVNQALIFYHFDTITGLLDAAYDTSVTAATDRHLAALTPSQSLQELLDVTRTLRHEEPARTDVQLMAQLLAAAQHDPALGNTARRALASWSAAIRPVIVTALEHSGLDGLLDTDAAGDLILSGFIGLDLVSAIDDERGQRSQAALNELLNLITAIDVLPTPARRTLINYLRRNKRRD